MSGVETAVPASQESSTEATFRMIYRSRNKIPETARDDQLGDIFRVALPNNKSHGICGALLMWGDWFAQTLEGDEAAVRELFSRIQSDPRHEKVEVIESGPVDEPVFARWAMAKVGEHHEADIPLIATSTGITEATSRGATKEQEKVLTKMRDATRSFGAGY